MPDAAKATEIHASSTRLGYPPSIDISQTRNSVLEVRLSAMHAAGEYLGPSTVDFAVKPIRLAYLVAAGARDEFIAAVGEASTRWGGVTELIIPYSDNGIPETQWMEAAHSVHAVDYFALVGEPDSAVRAEIQKHAGPPVVPLSTFKTGWAGLHQLAVHSREALAATELAFAGPSDSLGLITALGVIGDQTELRSWRAYGGRLRRARSWSRVWVQQLSRSTLIAASANELDDLPGSRWITAPGVVWVTEPESYPDAIGYWNTRALMPLGFGRVPIALVTTDSFRRGRFVSTLSNEMARLRSRGKPDVLVVSHSVGRSQLERVVRDAGWALHRKRESRMTIYGGRRLPRIRRVSAAVLRTPLHHIWAYRLVGRSEQIQVQVHRSDTVVMAESPVPFANSLGGMVRARISGPPISMPPGDSVAVLFHPNAVRSGAGIEIQTDINSRYDFHIKIPTRSELVGKSLSDAGIAFGLSDKGLLAAGVMARLVDLEVLRGPYVYDAIQALTTRRIEYDARALHSQFPEADKAAIELLAARLEAVRQTFRSLRDIASAIRNVKVHQVAPALEVLVRVGLAHRGFRSQCTTCGLPSFIDLQLVQAETRCPGCESPASLESDPKRGEPEMYYRLNSLVDRASDNGVFVHLLGVAVLRAHDPSAYVLPGVNLTLPGLSAEADLLALLGSELWFGEAKSSSAGFAVAQIQSDVRTASAVGAVNYVLVCLEPIEQTLKEAARQECDIHRLALWVVEGMGAALVLVR